MRPACCKGDNLYDAENVTIVHHVQQALRAHKLFQRDKDYIVKDGQVIIIDEFTGRMMPGRRYSEGLHQALEAKEHVAIQPENVTLASITFQNYFRLYDKLAGMTGTASTEAEEFMDIYKLDVVEIPTNVPVARKDEDDEVYRTAAREICRHHRHHQARPANAASRCSSAPPRSRNRKSCPAMLKSQGHSAQRAERPLPRAGSGDHRPGRRAGRRHHRHQHGRPRHRHQARRQSRHAHRHRTGRRARRCRARASASPRIKAEIEANKQKVLAAGGLFVIGTERHESRRIDNQLRGRSGRQGDPGRSRFYLSLEDDLMRIFGSERMDGMLQKLGLKEGEAIVHPWINKALEKAQQKVEARNFDIRKNLLKFDNVMNDQRKVIFEQRIGIMKGEDVSETIDDMRHQVIDDLVTKHIPQNAYAEQWDAAGLRERLREVIAIDFPVDDWAKEEGIADEEIRERVTKAADELYAGKREKYGPEIMEQVEKAVLLQTLDQLWRDHIITVDHLRQVIHLRGYGQRDPLNEYKTEGFKLFEAMISKLRENDDRAGHAGRNPDAGRPTTCCLTKTSCQ